MKVLFLVLVLAAGQGTGIQASQKYATQPDKTKPIDMIIHTIISGDTYMGLVKIYCNPGPSMELVNRIEKENLYPATDLPIGKRVMINCEPPVASYYADKFHGRPTANGEIFNMYALTAAHRIYPFGTILKVTHPKTGRQVKVRVNDSGPYVLDEDFERWRGLDLARRAAQILGLEKTGKDEVKIEVVSYPKHKKVALRPLIWPKSIKR